VEAEARVIVRVGMRAWAPAQETLSTSARRRKQKQKQKQKKKKKP
jgi:hypothetical protein